MAHMHIAHGGRYDIERHIRTAMHKSSEFVENVPLLDEKKITFILTVLDTVNLSFRS